MSDYPIQVNYDGPAPAGHCWHDDGFVAAVMPPYGSETCCRCGVTRQWRQVPEEGHGPHARTKKLRVTYQAVAEPCAPRPKPEGKP